MVNINSALDQAHVYHDLSGLHSLRSADATEREKVGGAAKQFESMMLNLMLKSMREANDVFADGNMLHSQSTRFYEDMLQQQLSLVMARGDGLGLAKMLAEQLKPSENQSGVAEKHIPSAGPRRASVNLSASLGEASSRDEESLSVNELSALEKVDRLAGGGDSDTGTTAPGNMVTREVKPLPASSVTGPVTFKTPRDFVQTLLPAAREAANQLGVDAELLIAQAALETGWGRHMISEDGQPSYNLFGIKADERWQGPVSNVTTSEYRNGVKLKEQAQFRAYNSYNESFADYLQFLQSGNRYHQALASHGDPASFAGQLQSAGYATDPDYATKNITNIPATNAGYTNP